MCARGPIRSRRRSRIVYATSWPGPWYVVWPPRRVGWNSAMGGDPVKRCRIGCRGVGSWRRSSVEVEDGVSGGGRSRRPVV